MAKFKEHEEKMKQFQEAKRNGGRPPINMQSTKNINSNENQPPNKLTMKKGGT